MTRKQQKEEKRKAILMTALEMFVTRGYYDTKITDIAKEVPMSTGLMFHYFESKEDLLVELVKMGKEGAGSFRPEDDLDPAIYMESFLSRMFSYAKEAPWVFYMFVLMGQARRVGMPEEARNIALSVDTIRACSEMIKAGQEKGEFREGDPYLLSLCFWTTVQGVMEEMAFDKEMKAPDPKWILAILKK